MTAAGIAVRSVPTASKCAVLSVPAASKCAVLSESKCRTTVLDTRAAVTRMSVAVAVPLLAIGAHGLAGGELPGASGMILVAGIGMIAGLLMPGAGHARSAPGGAVLRVFGVLTAAQAASHAALMLSHGHLWSAGDATSMLVTHLVAVPASALAIVAVAQLLSLITSVIRAIVGPSTLLPADRCRPGHRTPPTLVGVRAGARHAIRGPPAPAGAPLFPWTTVMSALGSWSVENL